LILQQRFFSSKEPMDTPFGCQRAGAHDDLTTAVNCHRCIFPYKGELVSFQKA
jgi:hypothetical protein